VPEPLVQSVIVPLAVCELSSLTGPNARLPGLAQLKIGAGVTGVVGVGVGVLVGVGVGVAVGSGVGVATAPGCVMVKLSEALRWLTASVA